MFTIACCLVVGSGLGLEIIRIRFSVWLVSCYAHIFVRLWVVIVTDYEEMLSLRTRVL